MIVNVLLVQGFLVALVGDIKTRVDVNAKEEAEINRISVFLEFKDKGSLPPPFNVRESLRIIQHGRGSKTYQHGGVACTSSAGQTSSLSSRSPEHGIESAREREFLLMKKFMNEREQIESAGGQNEHRQASFDAAEQFETLNASMNMMQAQIFELRSLLEMQGPSRSRSFKNAFDPDTHTSKNIADIIGEAIHTDKMKKLSKDGLGSPSSASPEQNPRSRPRRSSLEQVLNLDTRAFNDS